MGIDTRDIIIKFAAVISTIITIIIVFLLISTLINSQINQQTETTTEQPYNPEYYEKTMTKDAKDEQKNPLVAFAIIPSETTTNTDEIIIHEEIPQEQQPQIFKDTSTLRKEAAIRFNQLVTEVLNPNANIEEIREWYGDLGFFIPSNEIRKNISNVVVTEGHELHFTYLLQPDGTIHQVYRGTIRGTLNHKGNPHQFTVSGDFELDENANLIWVFKPLFSVTINDNWVPIEELLNQ